jgi:hypothetical protein
MVPDEKTLSEIVEIWHSESEKPIRTHISQADEWIEKLAFAPHLHYTLRLEHQKECDLSNPWDSYAFSNEYLCSVSNIMIVFSGSKV